ncbi:MAG: FAD:protein FMN transferase [Pseudomonadota bacterium]
MIRVLVPLEPDGSEPLFGARIHQLAGPTMGTSWQVRWAGPPDAEVAAVRAAIEQELHTVVAQMSTWRDDSHISHYNRAAPGSWHTLPAAMAEVLNAALQMAEWSAGAFNPAAGALVDLWGFGSAPRYTDPGFVPPDGQAVARVLPEADWRRLRWQPAERRLLQPGGLRLDFSAIAKGHAVDRIALRLHGMGIAHALVEVGGELRGQGLRPDGQPWWVELERPPAAAAHAGLPLTRIALHGLSVATSGDYRRFMAHGSRPLPHTIDPRGGQPIAHGLASVSVVHPSCMWADAWSTALTVLGPVPGAALARQHGIPALFIQRRPDGSLHETLTPALEALAA